MPHKIFLLQIVGGLRKSRAVSACHLARLRNSLHLLNSLPTYKIRLVIFHQNRVFKIDPFPHPFPQIFLSSLSMGYLF